MRQLINLMSLFVLLFAFTSSYADDTSKEQLSQLLKNMHSFKADFTQTIMDKRGRALQQSRGKMQLQRPGRFRWDVQTPTKQLIVTNGQRLWIYDPDLDQVTIRNLVKAAGETPAMLLSDETLVLGDQFVVKPAKTDSQLSWYTLTPRDKSTVIASLRLAFLNQEIKKMEINDHLGHTTLIEFNHAKMNVALSEASFSFKPPANIDIIDETKTKRR